MAFVSYEQHMVDILVSSGAGFRQFVGAAPLAWDITVGSMNDKPDDQICFYTVGGQPSEVHWLVDYPALQVKVRGGPNHYEAAREKIEIVKNLLVGKFSYTAANGDRIVSISAIGDVGAMGWDENKRPEFSFNFKMIAEPAQANRPNTNREPL